MRMSSNKIHTYPKYFSVGILQAFRKVKVGKMQKGIDTALAKVIEVTHAYMDGGF